MLMQKNRHNHKKHPRLSRLGVIKNARLELEINVLGITGMKIFYRVETQETKCDAFEFDFV